MLIYSLNLIALSEGFYGCLPGRTFTGLLELTSDHMIFLSSGFLGPNCSIIKNNHWLERKLLENESAVYVLLKYPATISL